MNLSIVNFIVGVLVGCGSLLAAARFKKKWAKISILLLGIILGLGIAFFPAIRDLIHSPRLPDEAEILRLLYGPDVMIQESPDGQSFFVVEQLSEVEKEQFSYAAQVHTQIIHKARGWENNPQQVILLTKTGPPECCDRSMLPVLGGAILSWEEETWKVVTYQKLIMPFHSFDQTSDSEIISIGPQKTAIVLKDQANQSGLAQSWAVIISSVDGRLKPVAKIETRANNADRCPPIAQDEPCWEFTAEYDFVPGSHPDYDDLQVRVTGTKLDRGALVSFEELREYTFISGEYQRQDN